MRLRYRIYLINTTGADVIECGQVGHVPLPPSTAINVAQDTHISYRTPYLYASHFFLRRFKLRPAKIIRSSGSKLVHLRKFCHKRITIDITWVYISYI